MMTATPLNTKRKKILQAIVEAYIETASAVSSQVISQRLRSRVSSATVRNVMAQLDELGLVWQPHTSAGRIPTDRGYRYYIDSLIEIGSLTLQERELIDSQYPDQNEALDELLKKVLGILSNVSGYTALALSLGLSKILFKRLELVAVQSKKLLIVLVSQEGLVKTALIKIPYSIEQTELAKIARFLNEEFTGLTLEEIKQQLSLRLLMATDELFHLVEQAKQILDSILINFDKEKLYFAGTNCILEQPEFQNARKLQAILRAFETEEALHKILKEDLEQEGIKVHIGRENPCEDIQECSLVVSSFKFKDKKMGTLGIIGPCRMSYARVISAVNYISQILNQRIAD